MPKAVVNGIQIHYEVAGSGIPVMLLVGLPGVAKGWGPQASLFAGNYMTILPDQRGAGQSSWPTDGYTIEEHASDMAGVLASLDCGPCHIVGSSTGGSHRPSHGARSRRCRSLGDPARFMGRS